MTTDGPAADRVAAESPAVAGPTADGPTPEGLATLLATARVFRIDLRGSFRSVRHREGILLPGPSGWGEFAPFADYSPERAGPWLAAAIEAAYVGWPEPLRDSIPVNGIVPAWDEARTRALTEQIVREHGCRTVKIKVADPHEPDEVEQRRVVVVREVLDEYLGPGEGRIRLDANAGWTVSKALARLEQLAPLGIEYVEQPCRTAAELGILKTSGPIPVAADEAIRIDHEIAGVAEFADVAIVKAAPLGGVRATSTIVERLGLPVVVSGSMDSSVGLGVGVALAGVLPALPYACGLGTGLLLENDLSAPTTLPEAGEVPVARVDPDPDLLGRAEARVGESARNAWLDRLAQAWQFVPASLARQVQPQ